ncbi:MAG TPA: hypothetical protein VMF66_07135 [Candidatus Acidoferrum sp.]|nr:hypothetical protein [Candidatus Acidoferrum sp.]
MKRLIAKMTHPLEWFLSGFVSGGFALRIVDYLIAWIKERREQRREKREERSEQREQRSEETTHEKDKPRFRVDVSIVKGTHTNVPTARVKILSLGSLPITINDGEVFIESNQRPEHVQPQQLKKSEITALAPIVFDFSLPEKLVNPQGVGKPVVKVVCDFSYGKDRSRYHEEKTYNHQTRVFE